ncbi:MAG: cytochrome c maturation protein CcmE [Acidimicrobiales bacterium]
MDVTPRPESRASSTPDGPHAPSAARRLPSSGLLVGLVLVAVLGAAGFLLIKQVGDASLYYYNADEAVAQKDELGERQFRVQGTYVGAKEAVDGETIRFDIAFEGVKVAVEHSGSEPALFKPGIPVVCEGRWSPDGSVFRSDRIEVKHSESYKADNPARVDPASP